ncbi:MAG: lipoyl(octanoyl) transferase LipB, partial [Gammaproteobacteria bacterium]|nr:lipoyl(octanoyl) transferase LipB [Gammaproteobacteria bacterium]
MTVKQELHIKHLGLRDYGEAWDEMQRFTANRNDTTQDEIWLLEHPPVFTLGLAGKREHLLNPGSIPVVQSDRGGQVTYHGPGQLIAYILFDLRRAGLGVRRLVELLQGSVLELLRQHGVAGHTLPKAPGVYVDNSKIAALGLRVRHGRSFHGLSLNVEMDLEPFSRINPCGYPDLQVTQLHNIGIKLDLDQAAEQLTENLRHHLYH